MDLKLLAEIRKSPRKMQVKYLEGIGLLNKIHELVKEDFSIKEKIDIILEGKYSKCNHKECNRLAKAFSLWCSLKCMNSDETNPARIIASEKQKINSKERFEKTKNTYRQKFGVEHNSHIPEVIEKRKKSMQKFWDKTREETFQRYGLKRSDFLDHSFLKQLCDNNSLFQIRDKYFNGMPVTTIIRHFEEIGFNPGWNPGSSSQQEKELARFIKDVVGEENVKENDRTQIYPKEIDIYIKSHKVGVEFHGLYWHSEEISSSKGNDGKYSHKNKMDLAKAKGITLLQFFADEWVYKQEIVKSVIKSKLGIYEERLFARKCSIEKPSANEAKEFFNRTHLQGWAPGSYYGLKYKEKFVAMICVATNRFSKNKHKELIRFSSELNTQVIGGFSKLINFCKKDLNITEIYSYSDLRYSNGNTYSELGTFIKQTEPGYFWVDPSCTKRINRFSTQKHKLKDFLGEKYDPSQTENSNMERNGYKKIWDCGQNLYRL